MFILRGENMIIVKDLINKYSEDDKENQKYRNKKMSEYSNKNTKFLKSEKIRLELKLYETENNRNDLSFIATIIALFSLFFSALTTYLSTINPRIESDLIRTCYFIAVFVIPFISFFTAFAFIMSSAYNERKNIIVRIQCIIALRCIDEILTKRKNK